jgi:glycosyltransferase involved in cell wall biosynthesis
MRVLMVTSSYPLFPGDVTAPFIESIAHGVAARGHAVDVVLPHHPLLRRGADEPVRFFPYRYAPDEWCRWGYAQSLESDVRLRRESYLLAPLAALGLRGALSARLGQLRYDALHVHWLVPNAAFVSDLARAHGVPLTVSLHGSDVFVAERFAPARALARRALRRAGALTACSHDLHRRAVALGARGDRARVVPYGVDVDDFGPEAAGAGAMRAELGVPDDAFLVLAVGRLVEKKGFATLVEAAARTGGVHLAIAGEGDLRADLAAHAHRLGVRLHLPGALPRPRVAAALAAADIVVVPSVVDRAGNVDGLPNALLEALAAGRPVVASRVAGIPDVVHDGEDALLVPPGEAEALAAALRRLLREPDPRRRMGAAARALAVGELSWGEAARRFEECYAQAATLDAR